jgi:hypothetical protein
MVRQCRPELRGETGVDYERCIALRLMKRAKSHRRKLALQSTEDKEICPFVIILVPPPTTIALPLWMSIGCIALIERSAGQAVSFHAVRFDAIWTFGSHANAFSPPSLRSRAKAWIEAVWNHLACRSWSSNSADLCQIAFRSTARRQRHIFRHNTLLQAIGLCFLPLVRNLGPCCDHALLSNCQFARSLCLAISIVVFDVLGNFLIAGEEPVELLLVDVEAGETLIHAPSHTIEALAFAVGIGGHLIGSNAVCVWSDLETLGQTFSTLQVVSRRCEHCGSSGAGRKQMLCFPEEERINTPVAGGETLLRLVRLGGRRGAFHCRLIKRFAVACFAALCSTAFLARDRGPVFETCRCALEHLRALRRCCCRRSHCDLDYCLFEMGRENRRSITCQWCCGRICDELECENVPMRAMVNGIPQDYGLSARPEKIRYTASGFTFCHLHVVRFSGFVAGVATPDLNFGLPKTDKPFRDCEFHITTRSCGFICLC